MQADVRGRVAGGLEHVPGPGVGLDRHARDQVAVAVQRARLAGPATAAALRPALERIRGDAALERDLDRAVDVRRVLGVQLPARVHPDLAAHALGQRRRLPAVIDVRVRDHDQPDVLDRVAGL